MKENLIKIKGKLYKIEIAKRMLINIYDKTDTLEISEDEVDYFREIMFI